MANEFHPEAACSTYRLCGCGNYMVRNTPYHAATHIHTQTTAHVHEAMLAMYNNLHSDILFYFTFNHVGDAPLNGCHKLLMHHGPQ